MKAETRFRWLPEARQLRVNEKQVTVQDELRKTLDLLRPAEPDFRFAVARRLTRELVKRGQANLAAETLPAMLFNGDELAEARAVIALEMYRLDKGSGLARTVAESLRTQTAKTTSPSATTLWRLLEVEKAPVIGAPAPGGQVSDAQCLAYTGLYLLQECRRDWASRGQELDYGLLTALAEKAGPQGTILDLEDPAFSTPSVPGTRRLYLSVRRVVERPVGGADLGRHAGRGAGQGEGEGGGPAAAGGLAAVAAGGGGRQGGRREGAGRRPDRRGAAGLGAG